MKKSHVAHKRETVAAEALRTPWGSPVDTVLVQLGSNPDGLRSAEAAVRLDHYGPNRIGGDRPRRRTIHLLIGQFTSPIVLTLIAAAILSAFLRDLADAGIILFIVIASGLLGFWQERGAAHAVSELLALVRTTVQVVRDGTVRELPLEDVVPGDVVSLAAGGVIPADGILLDATNLFVDQAALTGETFPVEKSPGVVGAATPLGDRFNMLFMGTHVVTGAGAMAITSTGHLTELGSISARLSEEAAPTDFQRGLHQLGILLVWFTLVLAVVILGANILLERPILDSLLFSLALAVGLTPQLLPAIVSVNLSHGARNMAAKNVIVKRLASIENLGSMNLLCSDKTGTLTEGLVQVHGAFDASGEASEESLLAAYLNAYYESGFTNPIDEALRSYRSYDLTGYAKLSEVPYDFTRKRLSVLVSEPTGSGRIITKGALRNVLEVCTSARLEDGAVVPLELQLDSITRRFTDLSAQGYRVLGVASKPFDGNTIHVADEADLQFLGLVALADPPKSDAGSTVSELVREGISFKMITGDNRLVAAHVAGQVGLDPDTVLTGADLAQLDDQALTQRVADVEVFAEVDPEQKERIIMAARQAGFVVGYLGDGINDAPALHAADVGISVNTAVDVAKEAADFVLLEQDLAVVLDGVTEGRRTFANTLKYIFAATSANFGNMFSMAGASLFLSFLPLLPKQILFTNLLTDLPQLSISADRVDPGVLDRPEHWDVGFIRRFMITFGVLSSVFDYATFGVLLLLLKASPDQFRTGWFIESVVSAALVVLVVRTRLSLFRSRPGRTLLVATLVVVVVTALLPLTPLRSLLGFVTLSATFYLSIAGIAIIYLMAAEATKRWFFKKELSRIEQRSVRS